MATYTASLQGLVAPTKRQSLEAPQRSGTPNYPLTQSPPKQSRGNRCSATTAALTASQDMVSGLPYCKQHSALAPASPCTLLPQHAVADTTTHDLETAFPHLSASEHQPDVLQVLTQQLAEQHIPFCVPSQPLTPEFLPHSSTDHLTPSVAGHYLLDRYLQDVPVYTTPLYLAQAAHEAQQPEPATPQKHSVVSPPLPSSFHLHLDLQHLQQVQLDETHTLACMSTLVLASAHSQQQSPSPGLEAPWQPAELCQSPHFACIQHMASAMLLDRHRCMSSICQSAEVLRLRSSRGQTWKGLALRQAIMGRALGHCDDEASVQDAAGGGGLLHGGAEDGGEGGGPSRGWGGAAGEDGDAEEDEDEEEEDEDQEEDEEESESDSSSEDLHFESEWTSSAQCGGCSMQYMSHVPCDQEGMSMTHNHSSYSRHIHQLPQSKEQTRTAHHTDQHNACCFCQLSHTDSFTFDSCTHGDPAAASESHMEVPCQQQGLASSSRYRNSCKQDSCCLILSDRKQQDGVLRQKDWHTIRQRAGSQGASFWKDVPDLAIRFCINVLGSCL